MARCKSAMLAVVASMALAANAMDLVDAWQASLQHDPQATVAQAGRLAGAARREQAASLWRPTVALSGTAGLASADTQMSGARFSAPGFGQSEGVGFDTSIRSGTMTRWVLGARLPLYSRERQAQGRQLEISADVVEWEWQSARQDLMLQVAQRYFDLLLADQRLALLQQQYRAVERALQEAQDRFALGDKPITDTHEASARAQALQAQLLAMDNERVLAEDALADTTGTPRSPLQALSPEAVLLPVQLLPLAGWLDLAMGNNPLLRMQMAQVQAAQQEVLKYGAATSASVDLVAQVGRDSLNGSGHFGAASNSGRQSMLGIQLNLPLYTGGYRSAKQEEALRLEDKARGALEQARQQITQHIRVAWLGLQTGTARLDALRASRKASLARLDATRLGRQVGDRTTLELLQAENDASAAEMVLQQARIDLLLNRLRLQALAGQLGDPQLNEINALLQH